MPPRQSCPWPGTDPLYTKYHDSEWGVPIHNSKSLFAKLILDGAQAGLSWITILRKRDNYYKYMSNLDPDIIARWPDKRIQSLLENPGVIRNRLKIESARKNARAYLRLEKELGSFSKYLWSFTQHRPIINNFTSMDEIPAETAVSRKIAKDLKKRGFNFVGPSIIYAFMQAAGLVNDHLLSCFRHRELR